MNNSLLNNKLTELFLTYFETKKTKWVRNKLDNFVSRRGEERMTIQVQYGM